MPEFLWVWTAAFGSHGLKRRIDIEHFSMYATHTYLELVLIRSAAGSQNETWQRLLRVAIFKHYARVNIYLDTLGG